MKIKKRFTHARGLAVWRLLINKDGNLLIEERDTKIKEVFYQCYHLETGKQQLKNFRPDETFWLGVEEFRNEVIYFHRFRKPDMPWHKDIIAYSLPEKKILWENTELVFGFRVGSELYAYKQTFEGAQFFQLNGDTGTVVTDLGENNPLITELKGRSEAEKDYSEYNFPSFYTPETIGIIDEVLASRGGVFEGQAEYILLPDCLLLTVHIKNKRQELQQVLYAVDLQSKKIYFEEVINKAEITLQFDSFFMFRDNLIVIRDKTDVVIYKIM